MLIAAKLLLGPALLLQGKRVRRTALRLPEPEGQRAGMAGRGAQALRLLVVGDSSAAGVGAKTQEQALALPLAKEVAERLDGAVCWQLIAQTGVGARDVEELVRASDAVPADIALVVLGVNDVTTQTTPRGFIEQLEALVRQLPARKFVFSGVPPMGMLTALPQPLRWYLGRYAARLDNALRDWCTVKGHGYCASDWVNDARLLAEDGYHPGPRLYPQWAARLAEVITKVARA